MITLKNIVKRVATCKIREAGKLRDIVVILRPPNVLGFRAKGCKKEYQLTAEVCYAMAVRASVQAEKRERKRLKRIRKTK